MVKTDIPKLPSMLILFKFGAAEHLLAFRERGLLHMRTMRYFAEQEADSARGDRLEGTAEMIQPSDVRDFIIEHPILGKHTVDPKELTGPVKLLLNRETDQNIFCMFGLTRPRTKPLHSDVRDLGTSFVLIRNTPEFLKRIRLAAQSAGLRIEARPVEYFDEAKYSGRVGPFKKSSRYIHQSEYRVVVSPGLSDYRELIVGSLEDITTPVLPIADIDSLVDFSPESARAAGVHWDGEPKDSSNLAAEGSAITKA